MPSTVRADAITVEIFANLFRAVVDEMAWIVLRSSHTTFVKETQDFATGLVTPEGELFSAPLHSGATANSCVPMAAATRAIDDWQPGDVLITNDPFTTGGMVTHLNDVLVFRPVFVRGELLCFTWAFIHFTDVGGHAPGSIDMQNHEVYQEGLRIRPRLLYRRGVLDDGLWQMIADNCRIPGPNWGDLSALIAALVTGEGRVQRMAEKRGVERVRQAMYGTLDRTERIARSVLSRIPAGSYRFTEYFEDDYVSDVPVRLELCLTSRGDGTVELDLSGSDPQVGSALNMPLGGHRHHPFVGIALMTLVFTRAPAVDFNAGLVRPIHLTLPEASVVNAAFPAACGMRITTANRVHDMVLGALTEALPGAVPSASSGQMIVTYVSTSGVGEEGRVVVANPVQGGSGAEPGADGVDGVGFGTAAAMRNVPVEILESEAPVRVRRFSLRPDSEGAGRFRSGFGLEYSIELSDPTATVVMRGKDRHRFTAWGAAGGRSGQVASNIGVRPGGEVIDVGKQTVYRPRPHEVLSIRTGGGGGHGDPLTREVGKVVADVRDGLIGERRARDVYGVVIAEGVVDEEATRELRSRHLDAHGERQGIDVGRGRAEWEGRFDEAGRLIAAWLPELPMGLRRHAQRRVYERLGWPGKGGRPDQGRVKEAIAVVRGELGGAD